MAKFQGVYQSTKIASPGSAGETEVVPAPTDSTQKIRVYNYAMLVGGASNVSLRTGTGGTSASDKIGPLPFTAGGQGLTESAKRPDFLFDCGVGERLSVSQSGAFTTGGRVGWAYVPGALGDE